MAHNKLLNESYAIPDIVSTEEAETFTSRLVVYDKFNRNGRMYRKGSLKNSDGVTVPMLTEHDSHKVVGKIVLEETQEGVLAHGLFNTDTSLGRDALSNVKYGALSAMSVGVYPTEYELMDEDDFFTDMVIHDGQIVEGSLVVNPAEPTARMIKVSDNHSLSYEAWKRRKNNHRKLTDALALLKGDKA